MGVTLLLILAGVAVLAVVTVDQMATILATGRTSGSLVPRLTALVWRGALATHRRWPSHRRLSIVGIALLVAAPALWATGLWLGWTLIVASDAEAAVEAESGASASLLARIYFAGFNLFTLGLGDVRPGSDGWRLVAVLASFMGLATITLGVSYLVPVVSAATERRHLARSLRQLGRTPQELLTHEDLFVDELMASRSTMAKVTEQHLTHPVLRYYHAVEDSLSLAVRTVAVWEALEALERRRHDRGADPDPRVPLLLRTVAELGRAMAERDGLPDDELRRVLLAADGHPDPHDPPSRRTRLAGGPRRAAWRLTRRSRVEDAVTGPPSNASPPAAWDVRVGCPKRMVYGPCGGVRDDLTCEVAPVPCPFTADRRPVPWPAALGHPPPPTAPLLDRVAAGPVIVTDLPSRPFDRALLVETTEVLAPSCDALLVGEHQHRPDLPPTLMAAVVAGAGGRPIVTLSCRDRNRVVLEQELGGLATGDVEAVLCVTGDGRAPGIRPEVTQVFDLDGTRLAALAAAEGLTAVVPESPGAPPRGLRPARLAQKQAAGARLAVLNHVGSVGAVRDFAAAAGAAGATLPLLAAVAVYTDRRSADVLTRFPGLHLDPQAVARVLGADDPLAAGIDAAVDEALALLAVDGVAGVNISGLGSAEGELAAARVKATVGRELRDRLG